MGNLTIYAQIDEDVKNRATNYVNSCKISSMDDTNNMKKLLEKALDYYIINHPVNSHSEIVVADK